MLAAGKDRTFDGRSGEGNTVTLGSKVGSRDTELHTVQPVILVFAVGLLGSEANGNRSAAILTAGNQHLVIVNGSVSKDGSSGRTDIVDAKGECAGLPKDLEERRKERLR